MGKRFSPSFKHLLLSPEWEGIAASVQRSVWVRGRAKPRISGARVWEEEGGRRLKL